MHKFHLKMSNNWINFIKVHSKKNKIKIDTLICQIIKKNENVIDKIHFLENNQNSKYFFIDLDNITDYVRDIYINLDDEIYNKLKTIHNSLNVFSIAQILRKIIKIFFQQIEKVGEKRLEEKLATYNKRWFSIIKNKRIFYKSHMLEEKPFISICFSNNFKILNIKLN